MTRQFRSGCDGSWVLAVVCPLCGAEMVVKTAQRGPVAGKSFWSCVKFPECRRKVVK